MSDHNQNIFTGLMPMTNEQRLANYRKKIGPLQALSRQIQDAFGTKVQSYYTWPPDALLWPVPRIPVHRPPAGFDPRFRKYFSKR